MDQANAWVALVGGALVVLAAVAAGLRWVRKHLGGLADFIADWSGEEPRPGVPGRPGVMERLAGIDQRLERVEHELQPNSGSSLRDAVNRVDARTARIVPDPE
jgi:hypothetical protein